MTKNIKQSILFLIIALAVGSCVSKTAETSGLDARTAEPTPVTSEYVRNGNDTVIKASGWPVPVMPSNGKYEPVELKTQGRKVDGLRSGFMPKEKMVVTIPKYWEEGDVTYKVTSISELKGKDQPPYCYHFIVTTDWPDPMKHPGVSTFFAYRDDDGDGIFETLAQGCALPAWVK